MFKKLKNIKSSYLPMIGRLLISYLVLGINKFIIGFHRLSSFEDGFLKSKK